MAEPVCFLPGSKGGSRLNRLEPVVWLNFDWTGGFRVLGGRSSGLRSRSFVNNDVGVGRELLGDLSVLLRHQVFSNMFVWPAFPPLHGSAADRCTQCHRRVSATKLG